MKIEEVIASTPNRFNASLYCSREDSIPAFNFNGSILSFGNSFSRSDRVATKHSTIPLVKSFTPAPPVNWIAPSRYSNSPANGSRKANSSDLSTRDSLNIFSLYDISCPKTKGIVFSYHSEFRSRRRFCFFNFGCTYQIPLRIFKNLLCRDSRVNRVENHLFCFSIESQYSFCCNHSTRASPLKPFLSLQSLPSPKPGEVI